MPTAFVLLNTEIGAENQVLSALRKIEGVEEAHNLWGVYDIIANVKAESVERLRYIITKKIGQIGRINSKLTMMITDTTAADIGREGVFCAEPDGKRFGPLVPPQFFLFKQHFFNLAVHSLNQLGERMLDHATGNAYRVR